MSKRNRANITMGNFPQLMLALQGAGGGVVEAAFKNRAYASSLGSATLTAPTIATPSIFTTAVLTAKFSGLFFVYACGTAIAGGVEAAGAIVALTSTVASTVGSTIAVGNGTATGFGIENSSGTTALTLTASAGALVTNSLAQENGLNGLASSALEMPFGFGGIFGTGGGTGGVTPVTVGESVAFSLVGQIATTTLVLNNFAIAAVELPF